MFKLLSRLMLLAAIGGAIGYFVKRGRQEDERDADYPEDDWASEQSEQMDAQRDPGAV